MKLRGKSCYSGVLRRNDTTTSISPTTNTNSSNVQRFTGFSSLTIVRCGGNNARMSNNPIDPLQALSAALAAPSDSKEQSDLLNALRENLEAFPNPIPILCATLISTVSGAGESLLKRWVLDLMHFALCRSSLSLDARTQRLCLLQLFAHGLMLPLQWPHSPSTFWQNYWTTRIQHR